MSAGGPCAAVRRVPPGTRLLAVVGPTAVGKTEISCEVAAGLGAEILSIDSMQVYRGMDLGTAKPTPEQRERVPFHLVDVAGVREWFSVARFKQLADAALLDITSRGVLPLLVGGSGLYYRAVVDDLDMGGAGDGSSIREELSPVLDGLSAEEAHSLLASVDHDAAEQIPASNRRRVNRALEVAYGGTRPISRRQKSWLEFRSPYDLTVVGIEAERELLYELIERRVEDMVRRGLFEEVRRLSTSGLERGSTAGSAIGYRQALDYIDGSAEEAETVADIKKRTRNYAKRQLTWFRADPRVQWFELETGSLEERELARSRYRLSLRVLEYLRDKLQN